MTTPRYIPPGLPESADASPQAIAALAANLRSRAAPARMVGEVSANIAPLAELARRWQSDGDPLRDALPHLAAQSGFSPRMWRDALPLMFGPLTADAMAGALRRQWPSTDDGPPARAAGLVGVSLAGNAPAAAVGAIIPPLLLGSAVLVKSAGDDPLWPVVLARSIAAVSPALAGRLAVLHWPGDDAACNAALAGGCDVLSTFGRAATMTAWESLLANLPADVRPRWLAHGPRTAVEIVAPPADRAQRRRLAEAVAADVSMYDQQGCLSPQQVFVAGPAGSADAFAAALAEALDALAARWPVSARPLGQKLAIRRARESGRIRRLLRRSGGDRPALADAVRVIGPRDAAGRERFDWTLLGTAGGAAQLGPGGRTVLLSRVDSVEQALAAIEPIAPLLQGLAVRVEDEPAIRPRLAALAIPHVCRPGQLQSPPFGWSNDNIPPLGSLVLSR